MCEIRTNIIGAWKLIACEMEYQDSGQREPYFKGKSASGYAVFTAEGRMVVLLVGGDREPGKSAEKQAALLRTMIAYTGRYRFEGDQFITAVDASWNEAWTGTEQVRFCSIRGDRLDIRTAWLPHPTDPGHRMIRGILSFENGN
jgi:Lipocalin-like domain